jgi:hypothetical protein
MHLCHELLLFLTKYIPCIIALYSPRIIFLVTFPNQDEQVKYHGVWVKKHWPCALLLFMLLVQYIGKKLYLIISQIFSLDKLQRSMNLTRNIKPRVLYFYLPLLFSLYMNVRNKFTSLNHKNVSIFFDVVIFGGDVIFCGLIKETLNHIYLFYHLE